MAKLVLTESERNWVAAQAKKMTDETNAERSKRGLSTLPRRAVPLEIPVEMAVSSTGQTLAMSVNRGQAPENECGVKVSGFIGALFYEKKLQKCETVSADRADRVVV